MTFSLKGDTLYIQKAMDIIQSRDIAKQKIQREEEALPRQRTLWTCSNSHVQGYTRNYYSELLIYN